MDKANLKDKWNAPIICFIIFFIVIIILFLQFCYLGLANEVYGINMKEFAANRNTVTKTLTAQRGTIYDVEGNVLSHNITSYTLIAYLDEARTSDPLDPQHVVDKDYTATKLSKILGEDNYEYILNRLNKNSKQVEFGSVGKNLTELTKLAIEELNLPGISFTETVKRYYPNGNFASYLVGYAKQYERLNIKVEDSYDLYNYYKNFFINYDNITFEVSNNDIIQINGTSVTGINVGTCLLFIRSNEDLLASIYVNVTDYDNYQTLDTTIVGELGIESKYEEKLQGIDGYIKYQQDKYGYQIPDTKEEKLDAVNGYDIYLTLDSNIQRFAENAINDIEEKYEPDWSIVSVMDAKSGSILASATTPSYNPNNLEEDMSYQNPLVSYTYEPGSVMKIYTYMCAIETGKYNGDKTYLSGSYEFSDGTKMHDWDKKGWGELSYDAGFSYSSNIAIINIIKDYLSLGELKACLENYGFGSTTDIELSNEANGTLNFKNEVDLMAAGYGQGISSTAIQQLQALSIIANDGVMIKPHIIDKIVNPNTEEEIKTNILKSQKLVSSSTITKIKDLMESVIQPESLTGGKYYLEDYSLIGKTGTAQIYENGKYLTGVNDYITSIALMYPKEDPKIIIYAATKKPSHNVNSALAEPIKELVKNISKYKGIFNDKSNNNINRVYKLNAYINKPVDKVKSQLEEIGLNVIVIGDGDKIIKQYPSKNINVIYNDKIYLLTNGTDFEMPNIINWSRKDILDYCNLINLDCEFEGSGYAIEQSIKENTLITNDLKLKVILETKTVK